MLVKLKILAGAKVGTELKITREVFAIGRGEDCQLRVRSDLISRRHCEFRIDGAKLTVRDCGSRNGTLVNGEKTDGELELKLGDAVKVGPLEFEVIIDHTLGGQKKPKVQDMKEVAARTANSNLGDDDVASWLDEADEVDRVRRMSDPDTRQFKVEHQEGTTEEEEAEEAKKKEEEEQEKEKKKKKAKKEFGKRPVKEEGEAKDTVDAAQKMLKKLFNEGGGSGPTRAT